jgi:transposase
MFLPPTVRIFLCREPTDMRRSFDALAALARDVIRENPLSGHVFLFRNRAGDRLKLLWWDRSGFCLFYKRLEDGTFELPNACGEIHAGDLALLLEGIDLNHVTRKKRYTLPQTLKQI